MQLANYRHNRIGGIDADRTLDTGEVVPYTLTDSEIAALPDGVDVAPYVAPADPVPQSITMRQCRLQLLAVGKLAAVDPLIDALPEPQRSAARIEWEYGTTVEINSPLFAQLGPALWADDAERDDWLRQAATL